MGIDFAKRINKQQEQLVTGEVCESAVITKADMRVGAAFGAVGVLASAANQKRKDRKLEGSEGNDGLASQIPNEQLLAGVTNQRLVLFGVSALGAKAKELKAAFVFADIASVEAEKSMTKWTWVITFVDGSSRSMESQKNQDNEGFIEMLTTRSAQA